MTVSLKVLRRAIALLSLTVLFFPESSSGQYIIRNPAYSYRENSHITIEAIHLTPDHLWIDFIYKEVRSTGTININRNTKIIFDGYPDKYFLIDSVRNIRTNSNRATSQGNSYSFSISFPFSIDKLLLDSKFMTDEDAVSRFVGSFPLKMNMVECSKEYRKSNNVVQGGCFDFGGISLNISMDIAAVLLNQRILQYDMVKDEFETTAAYKARTNPDTVFNALYGRLESWEWLCESIILNKMKKSEPDIQYNADQQVFTMKYPGVAPFRFKYPIDKARNFKDSITSKKLKIYELEGARDDKDIFYLNQVMFSNSQEKKHLFYNLDAQKNDALYKQTINRMYEELKRVFPRKDVFK